jgi:hypothetical protein
MVRKISQVIGMRKMGKTIEEAVEEVFTPENPPAGAEEQSEQPVPAAPGQAPAGGAPFIPPAPQQRPELQTLLSRMSSTGATGASARLSQQRRV